jgi:HPt (histidine-containing phosphotransfer) domain-containing protein
MPTPDLDLSFLYEIADGSDEFVIESIDMFLTQTPELLETIDGAIANSNWVTAASAAHKLKSNLGFFGMPISLGMILEVELRAKSGNPDTETILSKFNEVKGLISANLISLKKIRNEKEAGL